jgi:sec-independent protein translocase protein TatA
MAFGGVEWLIVIIAIVLLLFGAKKIPEFARNLGRAKAEFSRGQMMVEKEIKDAERADREREAKEAKDREEAEKRKLSDLQKAAKELGIDYEGRTDDELKELIRKKVESK